MLKFLLQKLGMVSVSLVTATFVAILMISIASAATYNIGEYSSNYTNGSVVFWTLNPCASGWTCNGNNAKYSRLTQGYTGTWKSANAATTRKRMDWYAFIPKDAAPQVNFGAMIYTMHNGNMTTPEMYTTPVNQTNWKGSYVYIGYLSLGNNTSKLYANVNQCVSGYICSSSMPVYFDLAYFVY